MIEMEGKLYRSGEVVLSEDGNTIELAFASEQPYPRKFGNEVLSLHEGDYDFGFIGSGTAPLLLEHDPSQQIGVVERVWVDGDLKARATVRFSNSNKGQEILQDIKDGIRRNVSVGYAITKMTKQADSVLCQWKPFEISIVSIPADTSVGVGRSDDGFIEAEATNDAEINNPETIEYADDNTCEGVSRNLVITIGDNNMYNEIKNEVTPSNDVEAVISYGRSFGYEDLAKEVALEGGNIEALRSAIKEARSKAQAPTTQSKGFVDLSTKEQRNFSLTKMVQGIVAGKRDGLEFEASNYIARSMGMDGDFIPVNILGRAASNSDTHGAELVNQAQSSELIKVLLPATFLGSVGGYKTLSNLAGVMTIPTEVALPSTSEVAEGASASYSDITTGQAQLKPTKLVAGVDYTTELLALSNPSVDSYAEDALRRSASVKFEQFVLSKILGTTGIYAKSYASDAFGYDALVDLVAQIGAANADNGNLAWLFNALTEAKLLRTPVFANTDSVRCVSNGVTAVGTKYVKTNLIAASTALVGNFSHLTVADWGAPRLLVDPYSKKKEGKVEVQIDMLVDAIVTQPGAFAKATDIPTA